MMPANETYSTRFAANRARDRKEDPTAWEIVKGEDGRFAIEPRAPKVVALKAAPKAAKKSEKKAPAKERPLGKRAQTEADAAAGKLPHAPDFSADTHKRFRPLLDEVKALVKAGDIDGLKKVKINPISTSPKAIERYRTLAMIALKAQAAS